MLLNNIKVLKTEGDLDIEISGISYDSRNTKKGDVFVAIPGFNYDGAKFIPHAIRNGASAVVSEKDFSAEGSVAKIIVSSAREALADLSSAFYDYPSRKLKVIGITGTNGKTTTSYLVESILKSAGYKTAVIGTVETRIGDYVIPSSLTTPESCDLQKYLSEMVREGVSHLIMEVSSHSVSLKRIRGIEFDIAVFTNLSHDHLDFHKTMESYLDAKLNLFRNLGRWTTKKACSVINIDDKYSDAFIEASSSGFVSYSLKKNADIVGEIKEIKINRMMLAIRNSSENIMPETRLIGEYNAYNILAAASCASAMGINLGNIKEGIESLKNVPGRFEIIDEGQNFTVVVDFAHSPDSLEKLLKTVNSFKKAKLILVFGCTGRRDKYKRPIMGEIAKKHADFTILTTDDPYDEDPDSIISEVEEGFNKNSNISDSSWIKIADREKAIKKSIEIANRNDIVVIAGRGHEKFQDVAGKKIEIDDRIVARKFIKKLIRKGS